MPEAFFDKYPLFYQTSQTGNTPQRLNKRYKALIENNKSIISGQRVLDIASHDGRWSFAALKSGALSVVGIEAREYLVRSSYRNFSAYNCKRNMYHFITGDVFDVLRTGAFDVDVIFCFGFFYHIFRHVELLSLIKRLNPKNVIIDTRVCPHLDSVIKLHPEDVEVEQNAYYDMATYKDKTIIGVPSLDAIKFMLRHFGFSWKLVDWRPYFVDGHAGVDDYFTSKRITIVATKGRWDTVSSNAVVRLLKQNSVLPSQYIGE